MGLVHGGIPRNLALRIREACGAMTLIETGTYQGDTAAWAAGHFEQVFTMEIDPALHAAAERRLARLGNVHCRQGDSRAILAEILPTLGGKPVMVWLDAHNCGGEDRDSPLLEEIGLVNRWAPDAALLIDDARFILSAQDGRRLCLLEGLIHALENSGGTRYLAVFEDVAMAVPNRARDAVDGYCRDRLLAARQLHAARLEWRKSLRGRIVSRLQKWSGYPAEA